MSRSILQLEDLKLPALPCEYFIENILSMVIFGLDFICLQWHFIFWGYGWYNSSQHISIFRHHSEQKQNIYHKYFWTLSEMVHANALFRACDRWVMQEMMHFEGSSGYSRWFLGINLTSIHFVHTTAFIWLVIVKHTKGDWWEIV